MKLGEKRGNSIFYRDKEITEVAQTQEPPAKVNVVEERAEEILTTEKENIVPIELGVKKNTHSIFFAPENEGKDFSSVLKEVQEYISENYAQLITDSGMSTLFSTVFIRSDACIPLVSCNLMSHVF